MLTYRVKTKQDSIDEFGENWRNKKGECRWGYYFNPQMDYLLGSELPNYDIKDDKVNTPYGNWILTRDMIKKNNIINYNEKKVLIYD